MADDRATILLEDLASGDEGAWSEAYGPLYREVWKVLKARLLPGFGVDWDDLACEILAGEIMPGLRDRRTDSFRRLGDFGDLLALSRAVAARRAVDVIRKVTRRGEQSLPEGWEPASEESGGGVAERGLEAVLEIVGRLKPPKPDLFLDYFVGEMTYQEIAEKRAMPLGTVCSHFNRGLRELREAPQHAGEEGGWS